MKRSQTTKELSLEEITLQLTQHVQSRNLPEFYKLVKELRPYDLSLIYKKFPEDDKNRFLLLFKPDTLADLAENLKLHEQAELLNDSGQNVHWRSCSRWIKVTLFAFCTICLQSEEKNCCPA